MPIILNTGLYYGNISGGGGTSIAKCVMQTILDNHHISLGYFYNSKKYYSIFGKNDMLPVSIKGDLFVIPSDNNIILKVSEFQKNKRAPVTSNIIHTTFLDLNSTLSPGQLSNMCYYNDTYICCTGRSIGTDNLLQVNMYYSTNNGVSWVKSSINRAVYFYSGENKFYSFGKTLIYSSVKASNYYTNQDYGILYSVNGGISWTFRQLGTSYVIDKIAYNPDNDIILAKIDGFNNANNYKLIKANSVSNFINGSYTDIKNQVPFWNYSSAKITYVDGIFIYECNLKLALSVDGVNWKVCDFADLSTGLFTKNFHRYYNKYIGSNHDLIVIPNDFGSCLSLKTKTLNIPKFIELNITSISSSIILDNHIWLGLAYSNLSDTDYLFVSTDPDFEDIEVVDLVEYPELLKAIQYKDVYFVGNQHLCWGDMYCKI